MFRVQLATVAVDLHQVAVLSANIAAVPSAVITWYNGSRSLQDGDMVKIVNSINTGKAFPYLTVLSLLNISVWDLNSTFTVVANSVYGSNHSTFQLTLASK
jgi:hypothetical protein